MTSKATGAKVSINHAGRVFVVEFEFELVDVRAVETATGHLTLDLAMVQEWADSRLECRDQVRIQFILMLIFF